MASITALTYSLTPGVEPAWTTAQEKSLSRDYPFQTTHDELESDDQFVAHTYLKFLWLPEVRKFS
jgi:hypothetical protein